MASNYSQIRFVGYTVPTTPGDMVAVGDPNGPGAVAGTYVAQDDFQKDVATRVAVLKNAVDAAKAKLPSEPAGSVLNVFVAPEFFFHGPQGPYLHASDADDPVPAIIAQLRAAFPSSQYPDWSFVCGSAITARVANSERMFSSDSVAVRNAVVKSLGEQWQAAFGPLKGVIFDMLVNFIKNCHAYPAVEVRNRALIVSSVPLDGPGVTLNVNEMTTEKYFDSNEDFVLYPTSGRQDVVTEPMTAYPVIDLSNGDLKQTPNDVFSIFRQDYGDGNFPQYVDFGVEICLDHSDARLRSNIDSEPFPRTHDALHVQIIPSCGMQIIQASVAADTHGFVFNCDGQYALDSTTGPQQGVQSGVDCIYANYLYAPSATAAIPYAGHTQLARVATPAKGDDPDATGATNASFMTLTPDITIVEVTAPADFDKCFAGGPGAVHIYGLNTPYPMYPS